MNTPPETFNNTTKHNTFTPVSSSEETVILLSWGKLPSFVNQLSGINFWFIKRWVAKNTSSQTVLLSLMTHNRWEVRYMVAGNSNTPPEVLVRLGKDKDAGVRRVVAGNPNTPLPVLWELIEDDARIVRSTVLSNHKFLVELYKKANEDKIVSEIFLSQFPIEWVLMCAGVNYNQ